jgi:hypothetical protein
MASNASVWDEPVALEFVIGRRLGPARDSRSADPTHLVQIGRADGVSVGKRQRRVAFQVGVAACRVIVDSAFVRFKIAAIPGQPLVEEFSAQRPIQAPDEWA